MRSSRASTTALALSLSISALLLSTQAPYLVLASPVPYTLASLDHARLDARMMRDIEMLRLSGVSDHDIAKRFVHLSSAESGVQIRRQQSDAPLLRKLLAYVLPENTTAQEQALAAIEAHDALAGSGAKTAKREAEQKQQQNRTWKRAAVTSEDRDVWKMVTDFVKMRSQETVAVAPDSGLVTTTATVDVDADGANRRILEV